MMVEDTIPFERLCYPTAMHQHSKRSNAACLNASASSNASFDPDNACITDKVPRQAYSVPISAHSTYSNKKSNCITQYRSKDPVPVRSVSNPQQIWNTVTCIFTIANGTWRLTSGYWGLWANLASCRNANCEAYESAEMR